jgi:hypothetical protein
MAAPDRGLIFITEMSPSQIVDQGQWMGGKYGRQEPAG